MAAKKKVSVKKQPAKKAKKGPAKKKAVAKKAPAKRGTKSKLVRATAATASDIKKGVVVDRLADRKAKLEALKSVADSRGYHLVSASDSESSYYLRRPTGITSLDIKLKGGFPAGTPCVLSGPDGAGKDMLLWMTCAEQQRIYGDDFACMIYLTEFKMDKVFMKDICGFHIGFTDQEIDELNELRARVDKDPLTEEEEEWYRKQTGIVSIVEPPNADKGFDAIADGLHLGIYQVLIINSLGNLDTYAKQQKDSLEEHAQQASPASLLARFTPRCKSALNSPLRDLDGKVIIDENGKALRNESLLLLVDQVRADRHANTNTKDKRERTRYISASGSWALKHDKAIELQLHKGSKIGDKDTKGKFKIMGVERDYEVVKGKFGLHEGITGSFPVINDRGVDREADLLHVAIDCGVIHQGGAYFSYDGESAWRVQGKEKAIEELKDEMTFVEIRDACFKAHGILYRHC